MKGFSTLPRATSKRRGLASVLPLFVLLAACGGGSGGGSAEADSAAAAENNPSSPATAGTTAAAPTSARSGLVADSASFPPGSPGFSTQRVGSTQERPVGPHNTGSFRTVCDYSHMAYDDPIVFPGQPGRSHLHAFFGNTAVNGNSTPESVANTGNSTCRGGTINRSGYWVPAMIDTRDNKPVKPAESMFYYKTGYFGVAPAQVRPFPAGLRMVAGDPTNRTSNGHFRYYCYNSGGQTQTFPNCPVGDEMVTEIFFPQCWDGVNLDSPDHKSHMAYPTAPVGCPASHPVPLPEITFNIHYPVTQANQTSHWRLSSDTYSGPAGYSSHADWMNGWEANFLRTWVSGCNNAAVDCHAHLLGNGQTIF
jgi:hypothetical protein